MGRKKPTVLVVDDEPLSRSLVSDILGPMYNVLEASDGEEAISMARKQRPALILMDILMPKKNGYVASYVLKRMNKTRNIPIVMITALGGYELNRRLAQDMGADGYITKPFDFQKLLDTVSHFTSVAYQPK